MLSKMKFNNIPIFHKLIITFLLIMTPLFSLSLILNELGKQEVQKQISNSIQTTIHYYFLSLEKELERIIQAQQVLINDEDLLDLSNIISIMSPYQQTKAINSLHTKLNVLKDSSPYIKNVNIYISSINSTISTSNAENNPNSKEEAEDIAKAFYIGGFPLTLWKDRLYLNLTYPFYQNNQVREKKSPLFLQNIEMSVEALTNALNSLPQEGGAVLFNKNWMFHNDKYPQPLTEIINEMNESFQNPANSTKHIEIAGERYLVIFDKSVSLDATLMVYFPENVILGQLKTYGIWFWMLVGCSIFMVILFSYGIFLLIHRPLQELIKMFRNIEAGNFNAALPPERQDEFGYIFKRFGRMVQRLKMLIDELYVQKIRLQHSELKQLQMQIAPHFLYNSFFILHRLIKNSENDTAELVSKNLGDYFRYITRNGLEEVSLEVEVNHVRSYVEIQNIRFSNRISIDFAALPELYRDIQVPRLILQPLVENAYEHGLGEVVVNGSLKIGFQFSADKLYFIVEDNGIGLTEAEITQFNQMLMNEEEGETTGLINIHRRLQLKYGEQAGLEIMQGSNGGLLVQIYIPHDKGE